MREFAACAPIYRGPPRRWQFTLAGLFRWVTILAVLCGVARAIGPNLVVALWLLLVVLVVFPILLLIYAWPLLVVVAMVLLVQALALLISHHMTKHSAQGARPAGEAEAIAWEPDQAR